MATTMAAPVSNSIALATRYLPLLDEVYKRGSLTSILDMTDERVRWIGAKTVELYAVNLVGLSDYDRNAGFVPGDTNGGWEAYTINCDRGRSYTVDVMDNDESVGMAFGTLLGEVERLEIIPEVDSYRLAKYAANAGIVGAATTVTALTDVADLIDTAKADMDNAEVPTEGRILFVAPYVYKQLRKNITRMVMNGDGNVNNEIEMYNGMRVIQVPESRFHTSITLNAPTSSSGVGGYTAGGAVINFLIVHPSAVMQIIKHFVPRVFSPEVNQRADAWSLDARIYHDCFVKASKTNGIYLCSSIPATPLALSKSTSSISGTGTDTATISNAQGATTAVSSGTAIATASITGTTLTITGVSVGTCTVTVTDGIGQTASITVTVS